MTARAYYNEIDPYAAAWLRNLIAAGHIAPGDVDERSIVDVQPDDLRGYTQCHFFAGIGVWSHSLQSAGWDDSRPVWTGSCPCQPFSSAGKRKGASDERHLWPHLFRLIQACRPVVCFGEQVASPDGLKWLDLVQADLEGAGYASGAVDTCAAGFGAPHIRQRLYWVAHSMPAGRTQRWTGTGDGPIAGSSEPDGLAHSQRAQEHQELNRPEVHEGERSADSIGRRGLVERLADADEDRRPVLGTPRVHDHGQGRHDAAGCGKDGGVGNPVDARLEGHAGHGDRDAGRTHAPGPAAEAGDTHRASPTHGFWGAADWLWCRDGKWRPVEPGLEPLAHGATARVGRLRAYGNAIVAPQAQAFVTAAAQVLGLDLPTGTP
ncbi:MAG: hypothetical protein RL148_226 [Planctomycetota bacterium]